VDVVKSKRKGRSEIIGKKEKKTGEGIYCMQEGGR
jgi:hypothetical protein